MKKIFPNQLLIVQSALILLFVLLSGDTASAQHCPFDGSHLVVIQLTDAAGRPITGAAGNLHLREINQPAASSCTYAEGLLNKQFQLPSDVFSSFSYYKPSELTDDFCRGCTFLSSGYYAVKLNQAEESCMIKKSLSEFDYRQREFEVQYTDGRLSQTVIIPKKRIYSLCTGSGRWSRIIPVKLQVER